MKPPVQAQPVASGEPMTRFCPGCGSVGEVGAQYRDCCPDGGEARMIPAKLAESCRALFKAALAATQPAVASSDELSFDEALVRRVTDAYAARFAIPPGYTATEVVSEVVRLIEEQPAVAPAGTEYRTCCDHPDCTTCKGFGGFYRLTATVPAQGERDALTRYNWTPVGMARDDKGGEFILFHQGRAALAAKVQPVAGYVPTDTLQQLSRDGAVNVTIMQSANGRWNVPLYLAAAPAPAQQDKARCKFDGNGCGSEGPYCATCDLPAQQDKQAGDVALTAAARDVLAERQRQISVEGWTPEHDDEHGTGEMAEAAACYITGDMRWSRRDLFQRWPWAHSWWKPKDRRNDLVRASGLLLAEIERLDRAAPQQADGAGGA